MTDKEFIDKKLQDWRMNWNNNAEQMLQDVIDTVRKSCAEPYANYNDNGIIDVWKEDAYNTILSAPIQEQVK